MNNIFIAFDFGNKNIGVAIGQNITGNANPLNSLKAKNGVPNWNAIKFLIKEWNPKEIIVGLPLNMDGTEQPITLSARKFANVIKKRFNISVKLHDERLSTIEAKTFLYKKTNISLVNKSNIDSVSAAIILESYLRYNINYN